MMIYGIKWGGDLRLVPSPSLIVCRDHLMPGRKRRSWYPLFAGFHQTEDIQDIFNRRDKF